MASERGEAVSTVIFDLTRISEPRAVLLFSLYTTITLGGDSAEKCHGQWQLRNEDFKATRSVASLGRQS